MENMDPLDPRRKKHKAKQVLVLATPRGVVIQFQDYMGKREDLLGMDPEMARSLGRELIEASKEFDEHGLPRSR